jgi:hypothetical protein
MRPDIKKSLFDGLHSHRLTKEAGNPLEVAFAKEWQKAHEFSDLLELLMRVPCTTDDPDAVSRATHGMGPYKMPLGKPTERDRILAATIIQWLGSSVGNALIDQVWGML